MRFVREHLVRSHLPHNLSLRRRLTPSLAPFPSHSLCTTEFIGARTAYEWLCDALEVYKPRQSEYGRLTLEGAITSKRKLLKLVTEKHVSGWDDPR